MLFPLQHIRHFAATRFTRKKVVNISINYFFLKDCELGYQQMIETTIAIRSPHSELHFGASNTILLQIFSEIPLFDHFSALHEVLLAEKMCYHRRTGSQENKNAELVKDAGNVCRWTGSLVRLGSTQSVSHHVTKLRIYSWHVIYLIKGGTGKVITTSH